MDDDQWYSDAAATFGDRLTAAREAAGLSVDDLAKRLGVKSATLHAWEDDLREPRANRISMLSGMMNVSLRWLLTGEGDGPSAPDGDGGLQADVGSLLSQMRDLRLSMARDADRLGRLEKHLRQALDVRQ